MSYIRTLIKIIHITLICISELAMFCLQILAAPVFAVGFCIIWALTILSDNRKAR